MISSEPNVGDIWLAYVAFADIPSVGKVRPALILSLGNTDDGVVAAKITASANWDESEYLPIPNWEACGLRKPSFIQLSPLFAINRAQLLRAEPIGRISQDLLRLAIDRANQGSTE